eukprot:164253-Pleurochrysis_carterae.AAC.1
MSLSGQSSTSAAARSAARSSCLAPGNCDERDERCTGRQSSGSAQSHTVPRAQRGISSCVTVTVGTFGTCVSLPPARSRSAATAASAMRNHAWTLPAYTPGRNRSAMAMGPSGRGALSAPGACGPGSRGSGGRSLPPRFLAGGPVGWESARPSGM